MKTQSLYSFDINKKIKETVAGAFNIDINTEKKDESKSIELVLSFKTIYKNTYNYIVIDINNPDSRRFVFNHEIFHVWEQYIKGILLETHDFLTISKEALTVTSIERQINKNDAAKKTKSEKNRTIQDKENQTKIKLHSLQECAFLQLSV
jgi:Zn-dependent peptidase ImmA (M78 family)